MLTKSSRRGPVRLLAGLVVLASLSGVARAQQSGLFPLHPIRRERVPCPMEDPVYKLYRSQYYGYFPTQWRPFPQGWNLPSPEGPNTREALQKQPIEASTPPPGDEGVGDEGPAAPDRGARPAPMPPPENERSPFDLDRPDNGGATAPGAGDTRRPAPRGNAPAGAQPSPFDMPDDPPATPRPRAPQPTRPTPGGGGATPDLNPPGPAPEAPPRTSRNEARDESADRDPGPLLAMPDASLPTIEEANSLSTTSAPVPSLPAATAPVADASPASVLPTQPQASSPRRSRLGSLFAGMGFNRLRR